MRACSSGNNAFWKNNLLVQLDQERAGNSLKFSFNQNDAQTEYSSHSIRFADLRTSARKSKPLFTRSGPVPDDFAKEAEVARSHLKALLS